ncbi:unnamed protein product [Heterosigma akashiwo]
MIESLLLLVVAECKYSSLIEACIIMLPVANCYHAFRDANSFAKLLIALITFLITQNPDPVPDWVRSGSPVRAEIPIAVLVGLEVGVFLFKYICKANWTTFSVGCCMSTNQDRG